MVITWAIVLLICAIGPTTIEEARLGPFFGVAGAWCWITEDYTKSRIFLEYMIVCGLGFALAGYHLNHLSFRNTSQRCFVSFCTLRFSCACEAIYTVTKDVGASEISTKRKRGNCPSDVISSIPAC